jgi:activator of 2-hydroxyglutaryl-CoA dehydratase
MMGMTQEPSDRLKKAVAKHRSIKKAEEEARQEVYAAILEDLNGGVRQVDITRVTDYTREHIRQLVLADKKKREAAAQSDTSEEPTV